MTRTLKQKVGKMNASTANSDDAAAAVSQPAPTEVGTRPAGRIDDSRALVHTRMGQVVLAMLRSQRYAHLPINDLQRLALNPLLADRIAFAQGEDDPADAPPIGMAVWASVSDDVAAKIAGQANAGVFPVHLDGSDWRSGDNVWLLDIIVPNRRAGTSVFMNFGKLVGGRSFRMHPVVAKSVDSEIVQKIRDLTHGAGNARLTH